MEAVKFAGADVDIIVSFDTTGGMYRAIKKVSDKIEDTVNRLLKDISIRVGIITHGDYGDDGGGNGCISTLGLTSESDRICDFVRNAAKTHGDDAAECYEYMLRVAGTQGWSTDPRTRRVLVVIGDDVPHPPSWTSLGLNWREEAGKLKGRDVRIYAVQALSNRHAKPFYSELASSTNGVYVNFKDFNLVTEASEDMLSVFLQELETSGRMDKNTFDPLLPSSTARADISNYKNLLPLIVNTAWWNPKLHDLNKKPEFIFDQTTKNFKDRTIHELSTVYENTHLDSSDTVVIGFEKPYAENDMDFVYSEDNGHPDMKKLRLDSPAPYSSAPATPISEPSPEPNGSRPSSSHSNRPSSSHSNRPSSSHSNRPSSSHSNRPSSSHSSSRPSSRPSSSHSSRPPSSRTRSTPLSLSDSSNSASHITSSTPPFTRRLINETDEEEDQLGPINIDYAFDTSYDDAGIPSPNNNNAYVDRLTKGRPRRASSFAFGDVSQPASFSSFFATPSVLTAQNKKSNSPFGSPLEDSGVHSDSETTRKRKATWSPPSLRPRSERKTVVKPPEGSVEIPRIGHMVAVRADGGGFWLARVVGFNGKEKEDVDVQWMDEIKSHENFFVLLDWFDTISINAIFKSRVNIENMKKIGVYKLPELEQQDLLSMR